MTRLRQSFAICACITAFAALGVQTTLAQAQATQAGNSQASGAPAKNKARSSAPVPAPAEPVIRFESMNEGQPGGDRLSIPRQIAAVIVAQDNPPPKLVVDFGSHQGEFLEAFMERIPTAHGQWTEPVTKSEEIARRRLARFGDRVTYVIGCPSRAISDGCVPRNADVIITSWVSIHQPIKGINKVYKLAAAQLPPGGWFINLDHITVSDRAWQQRLDAARTEFHAKAEGPGPHLKTPAPNLDEQIAAFKAAGFDVDVAWRSFTTVLFVARKRR